MGNRKRIQALTVVKKRSRRERNEGWRVTFAAMEDTLALTESSTEPEVEGAAAVEGVSFSVEIGAAAWDAF